MRAVQSIKCCLLDVDDWFGNCWAIYYYAPNLFLLNISLTRLLTKSNSEQNVNCSLPLDLEEKRHNKH